MNRKQAEETTDPARSRKVLKTSARDVTRASDHAVIIIIIGQKKFVQAHAFSLSREDPTASSDVDQGELAFSSPPDPDDCG